jgi:hypothetical protein
MYEGRRMKPVEIVLSQGWKGKKENDGGVSQLRCFVSTFVTLTVYPLHNYYMIIKL